ncbi:hypothetical protein [Mesoplasma corruscae]|uniref:Transmembrane protein n=1 Tax=Mesoplasma corruscae TaxID=216874 RepID=A0A2S5RHL8_9MOLU|nr:hypothetical protein [Mesoplasma corruscae]PPE06790.1 hypothetical protein MCORR_v1c04210 [Mesoplasma corruscae]
MNYLNLFLLILNFTGFIVLSFIYVYFTKQYYTYEVPRINSYNDVISNKQIEYFIEKLKEIYNLQGYNVVYESTSKYVRLFKNVKKNNKIVISKRIFESVGYEIDYLMSRIWLSDKKINRKKGITAYKISLKLIPICILIFMFIIFIFQFVVFIIMQGSDVETGRLKSSFLYFFWQYPVLSICFLFFIFLLLMNYFWSMTLKLKVERNYTFECAKIINEYFNEFKNDFQAARTYSIAFKLSFMPIYKPHNFWESSKWVGPFVYF